MPDLLYLRTRPQTVRHHRARRKHTTDRWLESLMMKDLIETLYAKIESEEARAKLPPDADQSV
jgi:hypothetical protein